MFEKQINRGVKFLNKHKPNWLEKISLKKLEMWDGSKCILGQLFKTKANPMGYDLANEKFGFTTVSHRAKLGFSIHSDDGGSDGDWYDLEQEWKDKITQLRKAKRAA